MGHAMSDRKKPVHRNLHVHRRGHHDRLGAYGRAANESGPFTGGGRRLTMTSGGGPSLIAQKHRAVLIARLTRPRSRQATGVDNHVCQEIRHDAPRPPQ